MNISLVVTTKSNKNNIIRLVNSLLPVMKLLHEVIFVDAGTPELEETVHRLSLFPQIIDGTGSSRGEGKNIGIRKATGDVIVFLDDDTEVTNSWLPQLVRSIRYGDIVAGYSPNPLGRDLPRVSTYYKGQDLSFPSCNIAFKKKVFDSVGLFDPSMITAEDMELNFRCVKEGFTIHYDPLMVVYHYHRPSFHGFLRQAFWNGYGRKQLDKRCPELRHGHQHGMQPKVLVRLGVGFLGYMFGGSMNGR